MIGGRLKMKKNEEIKRSPIFYMGNKYKLLKQLLPLFPKNIELFVDVFGGSGVVSANVKATTSIYNDTNEHIVALMRLFKEVSPQELDAFFCQVRDKYRLMIGKKRNAFNNEEEFQAYASQVRGRYNLLREEYNNSTDKDVRLLYLLACYSMNHLIRFNRSGKFNASCGVTQCYNEKNKQQIQDLHDNTTQLQIYNKDYIELLTDIENQLFNINNAFLYCDPPYFNTTAVYNEKHSKGGWNINDDFILFQHLERLSANNVKWGLSNIFVNRGVTNEHLIKWCEKNNWNVYHLSRNYNPFSRGNSNNDEVYICNYNVVEEK